MVPEHTYALSLPHLWTPAAWAGVCIDLTRRAMLDCVWGVRIPPPLGCLCVGPCGWPRNSCLNSGKVGMAAALSMLGACCNEGTGAKLPVAYRRHSMSCGGGMLPWCQVMWCAHFEEGFQQQLHAYIAILRVACDAVWLNRCVDTGDRK